jgi:hypothetical protein
MGNLGANNSAANLFYFLRKSTSIVATVARKAHSKAGGVFGQFVFTQNHLYVSLILSIHKSK